MTDDEHDERAERLRAALDLMASGIEMQRAKLRRQHPEASDEEIRRRLDAWLLERSGAEFGDAEGRRVDPETRLDS